VDLALRVHEQAYRLRPALADIFHALQEGAEGDELIGILAGESKHPRTPEQAGRCLRVLAELGLVAEENNGSRRKLRALSSVRTALERSPAFRVYETRFEEGLRFLNQHAQRP
jgi:hypothetical protein